MNGNPSFRRVAYHGEICRNNPIDVGLERTINKCVHFWEFAFKNQSVESEVSFDPSVVKGLHQVGKALRREVTCFGPHIHAPNAKIYGVRPRLDCGGKLSFSTCWGEEFWRWIRRKHFTGEKTLKRNSSNQLLEQ